MPTNEFLNWRKCYKKKDWRATIARREAHSRKRKQCMQIPEARNNYPTGFEQLKKTTAFKHKEKT